MKDFNIVYLSCKFDTNILPDVRVMTLSNFHYREIGDPKWRHIVTLKIVKIEKRKVRALTTLIGLSM